MYNTYVSSHIALRSKGSLCFSINDYYYSNERFEKIPSSSSSSSCTCCCSFSNHGMHINPRLVYGLRQSSLIHCYASRRLILSGGDRYCRSQSSDLDRVCCRNSYSLKESNISRRRKENLRERRDRRFRCMVWEEKFGNCDSGMDENVEAMLSLLTEDISEKCVGIGKRNSKLDHSGRIRVETRNGGVRECSKEEKKYVVSDSMGKKSRGETESNTFTSREDAWSGGRKGSSLRSENGGLRKEGSSCSSYYSMLSSGDLDESDVDIHVDDETYVSESLSSYENKESRKNEENLFVGNVTKQQKKYKEDVRQYGEVSTQGNTGRVESSVDWNSRNKVEKHAEVSVGRIGNRKESRVQDMYEIGVDVDLRNKVEKRAEVSAGRIGNRKESRLQGTYEIGVDRDSRNKVEKLAEVSVGQIGTRNESRVQDMYEIGVDVDSRNKVEKRAEVSAGRIGNRKESRLQGMYEIGVDRDSRNKVEKLAEVSVGQIGTRNESRVQDMYEIGVDVDSRNKVEKRAEVSVGRIGTRNESRVQGMYEIDVDRDSRNKVEKLAEVSVGRIGTRNESSVQDMYEVGVEMASSSQRRSNDRENSSTTSINYVEETKDQRSQTGHQVIQQSGSGRRTQQLSERLNVKDSSNDMASSSQERFSGREEKLTTSVNLGREARERNSQMDHRISQQNESMRKSQQLSEMSEIYNSAVERASSSQRLSETRMKTREENSSSLLSSFQETQERRTQSNQHVDWTTGSSKESQDLTNVSVTSAIDTGVMTSSQNRTEITRMQDKKPSSLVILPPESNRYNQTGEQVTSQLLSWNESERLNKTSSLPKSSSGRASGSQTPFNLVQQSREQQIAEQKEGGINSHVMVTPPPSQSVARGSTKTIPSQKTTKGYGTQDVTRESSKSSSSTLHIHSQEEISTLRHEPDDGIQSNEISPEQSELIINEDALVSANRLEESSTMFVGEFMDKLRHEVSTSELLEERTSSQKSSGHTDENFGQQSFDPQASEDFQSQVHGSRKSSSESRRKGPADEMWDVAGPSSMEPSKTEAPEEVTPTSGGRIAKSPRSLWSIISDVVRLRWGARSETHNLTAKSGGRSSSNESAGSERWFSGHEPDDKDDEYAKKSRRSTPKRSRSADKRSQRKSPRSQSEGEAYDGRSSRDEMIPIGNDTPPSSNVAEISPASKGASSASKEETYSWREDENREQATPVGTTTVEPSSSLLTKRFIRSPPVKQETFESNIEVSTSGSTEMVEQPIGERPTEATGTEGKDGELKRRKLQRNKQVLTERFEEWEEAYIIESEQRKIDEMFMREALLEAKKAGDTWEVPVGAVLVQDGKIIARGCNLVEELRDSTAHAEMICIREASNVLRTWRLSETTLYVTLEPCPMCAGAILQARVDTVVWGAPNKLLGADGSWVRLFPGGNGEGGSGPDMTAQSAGPVHPFHPKITIRRGILAAECADAMKQFFQLRRKEKKKSESPPPPTCLPIGSHHQSKIFSKMHDIFNVMFCL